MKEMGEVFEGPSPSRAVGTKLGPPEGRSVRTAAKGIPTEINAMNRPDRAIVGPQRLKGSSDSRSDSSDCREAFGVASADVIEVEARAGSGSMQWV